MDFKGLTNEEAQESRKKYGSNALSEKHQTTFLEQLKGNFDDPIIKILIAALILEVIFTILGQVEWYDSIGIAIAVAAATGVSTWFEFRNETAFQKLQEEASRIKVKVYRNSKLIELAQDEIVKGDYVMIQTGDKVPADGILIYGNLQTDQSVLNGEAKECEKSATTIDDKAAAGSKDFLNKHKLFRGSVVLEGNGVFLVTEVGDATIYGGIAGELQQETDRDTPLKLKLKKLAGDISRFGYIGGIAIAIAFMFQKAIIHNNFDPLLIHAYFNSGMMVLSDFVDAVILAVIIIVMAVPEGLPLMIAIVSAQNMSKMLKDNVLVRKINGIETAGSLNILFSDKTGTITKGKLEVVTFVTGNGRELPSYRALPELIQDLVRVSILKNTESVVTDGTVVGGNMTERALVGFLDGDYKFPEGKDFTITRKVPFTSSNKYSMSIGTFPDGKQVTLVKGAPEKILSHCNRCYGETGVVQALDEADVISTINDLAGRAIRILALAIKEEDTEDDNLPEQMIFIGAIGIRDDVRPESVMAIGAVHKAGVQVVMITGDRADTAEAIAKEAGLLDCKDPLILTSGELSRMDDKEVKKNLKRLRVVARALPSDKSRLVRLAQEKNLVVGMTGDGVNDSPALKAADVGFAMGSGTEVAKEASEIVILDDNFNSIKNAVLYGRTIYNSIRKFIIFQLTINVSAVLTCFVTPLIGMNTPLSITQILWINLIMDTLAALAFGGEPALMRYLDEKPKRRDENIVSPYMLSSIGTIAVWIFLVSMGFLLTDFSIFHFRADAAGRYLLTGYFTFFVFNAVFNAFNARTEKLNLFDNLARNHGFLIVMGMIAVVQVIMVYAGGAVMHCYGLTGSEWLYVLAAAFLVIPVDLIRKVIFRKVTGKEE